MADRYWVPGNTDANSTNSWSSTNGGAGGASVPTGSDNAYILNGSDDITTSSSITVGSLYVSKGFRGRIGGAGSSATIGGTSLFYAGQGDFAYIAGAWTTAVVADAGAGRVFFTGSHTIGTLEVGSAVVQVSSATTVTTLRGAAATVTLLGTTSAGPAGTTATFGGRLVTGRSIATLTVLPGSQATLTGAAACSTGLTVHSGATVLDQSSGTKAVVEVLPGGNYSNTGGVSPYTITTLRAWTGSTYNVKAGGAPVTITNAVETPGSF